VRDFFISYNGADTNWAEWIAWQLEETGYSTTLQAQDFKAEHNFVLEIDKALKEAERIIVVLSPHFIKSNFAPPEWAEAFKKDPTGEKRLIVLVLVRECELEGMLSTINHIDLIGLDEEIAKETLLNGVKFEPGFLGTRSVMRMPLFPGVLPPHKLESYFGVGVEERVFIASYIQPKYKEHMQGQIDILDRHIRIIVNSIYKELELIGEYNDNLICESDPKEIMRIKKIITELEGDVESKRTMSRELIKQMTKLWG